MAIEVVRDDHEQACAGTRHRTPHLSLGGGFAAEGTDDMSHTGCDEPVTGMILVSGDLDDVSCEGCQVAYAAEYLKREPESP